MSADGKKLLDNGTIVYVGKIAEGTKIYKRNSIIISLFQKVEYKQVGRQSYLKVYGPYEKLFCKQGSTNINGPHQLTDRVGVRRILAYPFSRCRHIRHVCHLQPVTVNDWPLMGCGGEPVSIYRKPDVDTEYKRCLPQTSDEFNSSELGLQWQWNHNPVNDKWSLTEKPGYLSLEALYADNILKARNTLTQKLMGNNGEITVEMNIENMAPGQITGLAFLAGREENWIGVVKEGDYSFIKTITGGTRTHGPGIGANTVWFRTVIDLDGNTEFYFSIDNDSFIQLGGPCKLQSGF